MDWGGQAGPFKRVNVRSHPSAPARWEWGGQVSSLGEEVGKDSTADGGQGDEQERWEVKALRQRPANSRKFELCLFYTFYLTDLMLYFTDYNRH